MSTLWLAITALSWIYVVTRLSIPFFTSPLRHLPSPPWDRLFIGHMDFNGGLPPTKQIEAMFAIPNDGLVVLWGPLYSFAQIVPTRPDTMMDLINTHNYDWEKPMVSRKFLARTLGEGLVNVEGEDHKAMRRVVAPAFSGRHIRELTSLFYSKSLAFADAMAREARKSPDDVVEMMSHMSRVTLDIIGAAGVGKDFNTIDNDDDPLAKLYEVITIANVGGDSPLVFLLILLFVPHSIAKHLRGTRYYRVCQAQVELLDRVSALIQEKKEMRSEKFEQQKDIIAVIMRSGDYPNDYLVSQLLTFLAAGHDTTASALTWTTWLLSTHPEIQNRLRAECNAHLADKSSSEINASIFDAETTPYLTAVCNEVLRLYPTVPATEREAVRPTMVGKQHIPKSTAATISPWAINRSESTWGVDADKFNPERWLVGKDAVNGGAPNPSAFLTFLHGPRSCIGQPFARLEMKCILAALVMRFRFELESPDQKVEVGGFITIKPHNGLRLRLHDLKTTAETKNTKSV